MKKSLLFGRKRTKDLADNWQDQSDAKKEELLELKLKAMNTVARSSGHLHDLAIDLLRPDPNQPRKTFKNLEGLAGSIEANGIIQPIIVKPKDQSGYYTIVAGERRFYAAKRANLAMIPCIVRPEEDANVLILQLLENDQRESVSPLEEAAAIAKLVKEQKISKSALAQELGRDPAWVSIRLGLQQASEQIRSLVTDNVVEDVRTLHELRKLEAENPQAATDLIAQFRRHEVTGSYRQLISQQRRQSKQSLGVTSRAKKIQKMVKKDDKLLIYTGHKNPVTFELSEEVWAEFCQSHSAADH